MLYIIYKYNNNSKDLKKLIVFLKKLIKYLFINL